MNPQEDKNSDRYEVQLVTYDDHESVIATTTVPLISKDDLCDGDSYVGEVYKHGGEVLHFYWTIVYRPSTSEVFKINCWTGRYTGYYPSLPRGFLPEHLCVVGMHP